MSHAEAVIDQDLHARGSGDHRQRELAGETTAGSVAVLGRVLTRKSECCLLGSQGSLRRGNPAVNVGGSVHRADDLGHAQTEQTGADPEPYQVWVPEQDRMKLHRSTSSAGVNFTNRPAWVVRVCGRKPGNNSRIAGSESVVRRTVPSDVLPTVCRPR